PLPPPTSTTTSSPRHSSAARRSALRSLPPAIARSKVLRSSGFAASQDQKSVSKWRWNMGSLVRGSICAIASMKAPPKRCANSGQLPGRSQRKKSEASVFRNTPGASSANTPSLASARDCLLHLSPGPLRQTRRTRPHRFGRFAQHAQDRNLAWRFDRELEGSFQRRERELVGAERALEWVTSQLVDQIRAPHDDARLRPAQELVTGEADQVRTRRQAGACGRLVADVDERAGAEIVHERKFVAL